MGKLWWMAGESGYKKTTKTVFSTRVHFGVNQTHQLLPLFYFTFRNSFHEAETEKKTNELLQASVTYLPSSIFPLRPCSGSSRSNSCKMTTIRIRGSIHSGVLLMCASYVQIVAKWASSCVRVWDRREYLTNQAVFLFLLSLISSAGANPDFFWSSNRGTEICYRRERLSQLIGLLVLGKPTI